MSHPSANMCIRGEQASRFQGALASLTSAISARQSQGGLIVIIGVFLTDTCLESFKHITDARHSRPNRVRRRWAFSDPGVSP